MLNLAQINLDGVYMIYHKLTVKMIWYLFNIKKGCITAWKDFTHCFDGN